MSLRFLKKQLLTPLKGRKKVKDLDLSKFKLNSAPGKSCKRFKKRRLKDIKNAKVRAKRKAENGTGAIQKA